MTRMAVTLMLAVATATTAGANPESSRPRMAALLTATSDLPGGICVVTGSSGADLPIRLSKQGAFVVHALYTEASAVDAARKTIRAAGAYGKVSADRSNSARLPYTENLINLVVVDGLAKSPADAPPVNEVLRVLAPLGVAYFGDSGTTAGADAKWGKAIVASLRSAGVENAEVQTGAGTWVKAVKPWPADIDEWTHYLHGADGNAVAQDRVVGPPKHYQWISGPIWLRSHESDSSVRTQVTARGRLFTIVDEAPISLPGPESPPDKWFLRAQDAFNGVILWKVPIPDWGWRAWKPSWFTPRPGGIPLNIEKRLVAMGDKVYVTLGYRAPVSQLDAKTGKTLQTYAGTERTMEILHHDGVLILPVLRDNRIRVLAVEAASGKQLWASKATYAGTTVDYYRFTAMGGRVKPAKVDPTVDVATDGKVVALLDGEDVVALDYRTGRETWRKPFPTVQADHNAGRIDAGKRLWTGTVITIDGVVVHASPNNLAGFSAETGKLLWAQPKKYIGHLWYEWKDVFVIDGLVWTWSAETTKGKLDTRGGKPQSNHWPVNVNGYDLHTGKLTKSVPLGAIFKTHHHHRCYRNKATTRYILASRRGTEFVDIEQGKHTVDNWVRGTCHVGMIPANGLQYAPPHPCKCYVEEKLNGMNALAAARPGEAGRMKPDAPGLIERGPAFGRRILDPKSSILDPAQWPEFRGDAQRSGAVKTKLPAKPTLLWREKIGAKVAPPIAVTGRVYIPLVDEHHVVSLNGADGAKVWEFATGGRIDSPPTYHKGTLIFGSADGWVYCVRADDGKLIWRYRAGPEDRRMAAFGQLESVWPVHGSVLVRDDVAYFAAGRSSHLDGGIRVTGLDAATGKLRCRTTLAGPSYTVDNIKQNYLLPMGVLPDILQSAGKLIFMRDVAFNTELQQQKGPAAWGGVRLKTMAGYLDDSYFKRVPWTMSAKGGGYARLIVHDETAAYSVRMFDSLQGLDPKVYFTPGKKGYLLFAANKQTGKQTWSQRIAIRATAMVAVEGMLVVAGPPDVIDPKDPLAAFEGRKGGVLAVFDSATGKKLSECKLPSPPVFNGAAAANGRLYIAMQDGSVACFGQ